MSSILIRRVEDTVKNRLKTRASRNGRSMEEEARAILKAALSTEKSSSLDLGKRIHSRFAALGGVELPEIPREPARNPPDFR